MSGAAADAATLDALHVAMRLYTVSLVERRGPHMHDWAERMHARQGRGFVLQTLETLDVTTHKSGAVHRFKLRYATAAELPALGHAAPAGALKLLAEYDPAESFVMLQALMVPGGQAAGPGAARYSPMYVPARIGPFDTMLECAAAGCEGALPLNARGVRMKHCTRCKIVSYCSEACQRRDWAARHTHECAATA